MANPRCTLQLLFLGLLIAPAFLQQHPCEIVKSTVRRGTFTLDVSPPTYSPGGIYTVTISGIDNSTSVILQALSADSRSGGLWENENEAIGCSGMEYVVQKNVSGNGTRTRWTSPNNSNEEAVHIRAFVTFANGTTLTQSYMLTKDLTAGVTTPATSTASHATHTTSKTHRPTIHHDATADHHHHHWASFHNQSHNSASVSQTSSVLLAAMQVLPAFLGFRLLS
ncbi:placenta-expressed transcript 1 protein-like [Sphaerodactylus townsendi]|uniref:Uncharacterized protein n=1 Tax=Sphaerodactylus townsendi TaxID=933632 RepID=A0ACB8EY58_9SAUR|nr:placenta-expressed transcript 1 protein-like [Sphaerodactylus townsendi]